LPSSNVPMRSPSPRALAPSRVANLQEIVGGGLFGFG
jgi:hypothetical protein